MGNQSSRPFFGESMQQEGCLWVPDEERAACFHCESQFTMSCRRHHCRVCGELFCDTERPVFGVKKKKQKGNSDETTMHHSTKNHTTGYGAVGTVDENQAIVKLGSAPTCWGPKIHLTSNLFPSAVAVALLRLERGAAKPTKGASKGASDLFNDAHMGDGYYSPAHDAGLTSQQKKHNAKTGKLVRLLLQEPQAVCTVCYRLLTFPLLRQLSLNIRSVMSDHQPRNVFVVRISLHAITHKRGTVAGSSRNEHFLTLEALARAEAGGLDVVPMLAMMKDKKTSDHLIGQEEIAITNHLSASIRHQSISDGSETLAQRMLAGAAAAQKSGGATADASLADDSFVPPSFSLLVPPSTAAADDRGVSSPSPYRRSMIGSLLETPAFSVAYPQEAHPTPVITEGRLRQGSISMNGPASSIGSRASSEDAFAKGEQQPSSLLDLPESTMPVAVDANVESAISGPNALDVATALTDVLTHHSTRPIGGTGLLEMTLEQWRPFNKQTRFVFRVPDLDLYQQSGGDHILEEQLSPMLRKVSIPPMFEAAAMAAELEERRRRNRMMMRKEFEMAGLDFPAGHEYSVAMVNHLGKANGNNANTNVMVSTPRSRRDSGSEEILEVTSPTNGMVDAEEQGRLLNFPEPTVRGRVMSGIPGTFRVKEPETHSNEEASLPTMTPTTHLILAAGTGSRGGHRAGGDFKPTKMGNAHTSDFGEAATGRDEAARKADEAERLHALGLRRDPVSAEELLKLRQEQDEQERLAEAKRLEQEQHDIEEFERRQAEAAEHDRLRKEAEMERRRLAEEAKKAARKAKPYFNIYHSPSVDDPYLPRPAAAVCEKTKNDEFADYSVPARIVLASKAKSTALEKAYVDFNVRKGVQDTQQHVAANSSFPENNGDDISSSAHLQEGGGAVSSAMFLENPSLPPPAVSERRIKAAFDPALQLRQGMLGSERRLHERKAMDHAARQFRQDTIATRLSAVPGATPILAPQSVKRPSRLLAYTEDSIVAAPPLNASLSGTYPLHKATPDGTGQSIGTAPFLQHTAAHQEEIAKQLSHINSTAITTNSPPTLPIRGASSLGDTTRLAQTEPSSTYHAAESAVAPALKKKSRRGKRFTDLSLHIADDGSQLEVKLPPVWSLSCSSVVGIELMQGRQVDPEKIAEEKMRSAEKIAGEEGTAAAMLGDSQIASSSGAAAVPPKSGASPSTSKVNSKAPKADAALPTGSAPVPLGVVGTHYLRVETFQEIYYFTFDIDHQQQLGVVKREQKALKKRDKHRSPYSALQEEARRNLGMSSKGKGVTSDVGSAVHLRPLGDLYSAITGFTIPDAASMTAAGMVEALRRKKLIKEGKPEGSLDGTLIMPRSSPEAVVNYLDEDLTDPERVKQMKGSTAGGKKCKAKEANRGDSGLPSTVDGINRPLTGADLYGAMRQAVDMARVRGRVRVSSVRIGGL